MAKLRAEIGAGQPQADVLLIADAVTMEGLKKEGRLLAYDAADVSAYPAGLHDKDKAWFATKLITTGIVYNTKAPAKPISWLDLLKPHAFLLSKDGQEVALRRPSRLPDRAQRAYRFGAPVDRRN
jgi:iron(III) transport system substrate-binding protein